MKRTIFTLILALLVIFSASAQEEMFKVLASKGETKVISNGSEQKVLIGKKLFKDDKIVLGENAYLGLAHKSGKTIELKKAGTYEVSKLSGEVVSQNASVAKKYVDFVAGEITSKDEDMAKNRHKYMAVTGSVERSTEGALKIVTPKEAYVLAGPVMLKWQAVENAEAYVVTLTDLAEEPVYTIETKETFVVIDLSKLNFKAEKNYLWKVSVKNSKKKIESEKAILKYVDEDKAPQLEKAVSEIKTELSEETALNKLVLASFYEENGLILDALSNYEAAMKLEPEVEDYKVAYGKFLERNKLATASAGK
jgi:hypothetical protein